MDIDTVETQEDDLKELFNVMTRDAVAQVKEHDSEILSVIKVLGGNVGQYKRERKAAMRAVVSEIYSPPRVTAAAKLLPELKLIPGFALGLTFCRYRWATVGLRRRRDARPREEATSR